MHLLPSLVMSRTLAVPPLARLSKRLLLVVEKSKLIGVIGEEDLLIYISENPEKRLTETVQGIIKRPIFVEADDTVAAAIGKTIDNDLSRIPVVDSASNMQCVGIISATDLLKEAAKEK